MQCAHKHTSAHVILPGARITIIYFAWFRGALSYFSPMMDTSVVVGRKEEGLEGGRKRQRGKGRGGGSFSSAYQEYRNLCRITSTPSKERDHIR